MNEELPDSFPVACYDTYELEKLGYTLDDCEPMNLKGTIYYALKKDVEAERQWAIKKFGANKQ